MAFIDSQIVIEYGTGIIFASYNSNKRKNREQSGRIFLKMWKYRYNWKNTLSYIVKFYSKKTFSHYYLDVKLSTKNQSNDW